MNDGSYGRQDKSKFMSYQKTESFHIVQIVIKNTSTLDFSLPILWGLRKKYPNAKISILYTSLNKNQILRNSKFMTNFCDENNIGQYDFCDFLIIDSRWLSRFLRRVFIRSYSDKLDLKDFRNLWKSKPISIVKSLYVKLIMLAEKIFSKLCVNHAEILEVLNPDIVLFDNRSVTAFVGRDSIYKFFETKTPPVVLLPHAPHYIGPSAEFCVFDEHNKCLMPEYTEHWMPFKHGEPWKAAPSHYEQFVKIGYPGLDKLWWNYLSTSRKVDKTIQCLVMTRKFLPEFYSRPAGFDEATLDYDETFSFLAMLASAIRVLGVDIQVIVKPHPSSNKLENHKILEAVGFKNYKISYDSFYDVLPRVDLVVSQFSTALALPIAYSIPTMLVETKLQLSIHNRWPILADFYLNLKYYSLQSELTSKFAALISDLTCAHHMDSDYELLRNFFDDGSLDLAIARVGVLLEKKNGTS